MSIKLSDNSSQVVLSCYTKEDSAERKQAHDGDGVNIIMGDGSGKWQIVKWTGSNAPDTNYLGNYFFGWLNSNLN